MNFIIPLFVLFSGIDSETGFVKPVDIHVDITPGAGPFTEPVDFYVDPARPVAYSEIRDQAIRNCKRRKPGDVNEDIIDLLIEVEKTFNVPANLRGMLLSAACLESGYNPEARGDRKFSRDNKKAKAIGILQQWKWYEKYYGTDRTDPRSAAETWMTHIVRKIDKVKKLCGFESDKKVWVAAWVTAIRAPKANGRCYEKPNHYKLLKKWHKDIRLIREEGDGC